MRAEEKQPLSSALSEKGCYERRATKQPASRAAIWAPREIASATFIALLRQYP